MNKKTVAIIVGIVAVAAIIAVSIWGILSDAFSKTIYVTKVEFTNSSIQLTDDNIKVIIVGDDVTTVQLEWEVSPETATNKSIEFQSNNSGVTITAEGLVTLNGVGGVQITIKSKDGTNKTDSVQILRETPSLSSANVGINSEGVVFETSDEEARDLLINQLTELGGQIVLFEGIEYSLNTEATITLQDNTNTTYDSDDKKLITTTAEDLQMTITAGEYSRQINVKVVPYISLFGKGAGIIDFENMTEDLATNSQYLNTLADKTYLVGTANAFHFDTSITSGLLTSLNYSTCELVYTITKINTSTGTYALADYATVNPNGSITFLAGEGNANIGKTFEMSVAPKYLQPASTINTLTFRFQLNNGVNVFNHADLKTAYADLSIEGINLHSKITPVLDADQKNTDDGTAKNFTHTFEGAEDIETGNVYTRVIKAGHTGTVKALTINGNYFTVDGSDLPLVNALDRGDGQSGNLPWPEEAGIKTPVSSVQVGIFHLNDNRADIGNDAAVVKYSNMTVIANTSISPQYKELKEYEELEAEDAEEVAKLGSGYIAILARTGGKVETNNCIVMKSVLALWAAGENTEYTIRYTYVNENWAGGYYGYNTAKVSIYNSTFGSSGGPSLSFEDTTVTTDFSDPRKDPVLTIGPNVVFDNYVSGTEGWFIVNGTSTLIPTLKTTINSGIGATGKTITKTVSSGGQNYEVFNFILMEIPAGDLKDTGDPPAVGVQITINFDMDGNGIPDADSFQRFHNDPNTGAIGAYSTEEGFNKGLYIGATLMTEWLTPENITAVLTKIAVDSTELTEKQSIIYQTFVALEIDPVPTSEQQTELMLRLGSNPTVQGIIMQDSNVYGVIAEILLGYYADNTNWPTAYPNGVVSSVATAFGAAYAEDATLVTDSTKKAQLIKYIATYNNNNAYLEIVEEELSSSAYFDIVVDTVKGAPELLEPLTKFVTGIGMFEEGAKYFETKQNIGGFGSLYLIVEYFEITA